jgi:hypothetical protein
MARMWGEGDGPTSSDKDEGIGKMNLNLKKLWKFCGGAML